MDTTSRSDSSSELVQPFQKSQQMQQHVNVNEDHREKEDEECQLSEYDSDSDASVSDQLNEEEGTGGHCRYLRGLTQTRSGRSLQLSFKALEVITQF